jgi:prepilin-type N-terminal cleavage/methylation domain-containing protein
MRNKKLQSGYTLIELLAVMIILTTVGLIITSILASSLRSGNKSTTTNDIRQVGNDAMAQMSKMIEYAKSFDGVSSDNLSPHVWSNCVVPSVIPTSPTPTPITYYSVEITSFDGGQTIFNCANTVLSSQSAGMITNLNPINTDATCSFTCNQSSALAAPTIDINLTLKRKAQSGGLPFLPEAQTVINFQTSVTLRNSGL